MQQFISFHDHHHHLGSLGPLLINDHHHLDSFGSLLIYDCVPLTCQDRAAWQTNRQKNNKNAFRCSDSLKYLSYFLSDFYQLLSKIYIHVAQFYFLQSFPTSLPCTVPFPHLFYFLFLIGSISCSCSISCSSNCSLSCSFNCFISCSSNCSTSCSSICFFSCSGNCWCSCSSNFLSYICSISFYAN